MRMTDPTSLQEEEVGGRILLVEDDGDLRATLAEVLEDEGFTVAIVGNGRAALETLRRDTPPDLILLDLMMPEMDGWQFRMAQREDARISDVPVVVFSADASPKAAAIDAQLFLPKPVDTRRLVRGLRDTLRAARLRRAAEADRLTALGVLAAGMAHEINNPLTWLISNLQLAREKVPRLLEPDAVPPPAECLPEVEEMLRDAEEGAHRIGEVVRQVHTFSRPEAERREPVEVGTALEVSLRMADNELRHRAEVLLEVDQVPRVYANRAQLGQVFLNLLLNAAQAISPGNTSANQVRVRVYAQDRFVVVEVADTREAASRAISWERSSTPSSRRSPSATAPGWAFRCRSRSCGRSVATSRWRAHPDAARPSGCAFQPWISSRRRRRRRSAAPSRSRAVACSWSTTSRASPARSRASSGTTTRSGPPRVVGRRWISLRRASPSTSLSATS
jgi:CheY-like chemotaxis protein